MIWPQVTLQIALIAQMNYGNSDSFQPNHKPLVGTNRLFLLRLVLKGFRGCRAPCIIPGYFPIDPNQHTQKSYDIFYPCHKGSDVVLCNVHPQR